MLATANAVTLEDCWPRRDRRPVQTLGLHAQPRQHAARIEVWSGGRLIGTRWRHGRRCARGKGEAYGSRRRARAGCPEITGDRTARGAGRILDAQVTGCRRSEATADYLRRLAEGWKADGDQRARRAGVGGAGRCSPRHRALESLARSTAPPGWERCQDSGSQIPHVGDSARAVDLALSRAEILDTKLDRQERPGR